MYVNMVDNVYTVNIPFFVLSVEKIKIKCKIPVNFDKVIKNETSKKNNNRKETF